MELELESVRRWFPQPGQMQRCAQQISNDTPEDVAKFYSVKHGDIFTGKDQENNFAFCVFKNSAISVTDNDFSSTGSFHQLLDECHRRLRTAVRSLFGAVAIQDGTVPATEDPQDFAGRFFVRGPGGSGDPPQAWTPALLSPPAQKEKRATI